jgi:CHASE3 domain sensor protein
MSFSRSRPLAGVGIAITITFLALVVATANRAREVADRHKRSDDLSRAAEAVLTDTLDAETGQRGWIITGDELFLLPYRKGAGGYSESLESLRVAADRVGDREQTERVGRIAAACESKFAELAETVNQKSTGRHDDAVGRVRAGSGRAFMASIRSDVKAIHDRETARAAEDSRRASDYAAESFWTAVMGLAAHGLLFLLMGFAREGA